MQDKWKSALHTILGTLPLWSSGSDRPSRGRQLPSPRPKPRPGHLFINPVSGVYFLFNLLVSTRPQRDPGIFETEIPGFGKILSLKIPGLKILIPLGPGVNSGFQRNTHSCVLRFLLPPLFFWGEPWRDRSAASGPRSGSLLPQTPRAGTFLVEEHNLQKDHERTMQVLIE